MSDHTIVIIRVVKIFFVQFFCVFSPGLRQLFLWEWAFLCWAKMPVGVSEKYALQQAGYFCCFLERKQAERSKEFHLGSVHEQMQPASVGDQSSLGSFSFQRPGWSSPVFAFWSCSRNLFQFSCTAVRFFTARATRKKSFKNCSCVSDGIEMTM